MKSAGKPAVDAGGSGGTTVAGGGTVSDDLFCSVGSTRGGEYTELLKANSRSRPKNPTLAAPARWRILRSSVTCLTEQRRARPRDTTFAARSRPLHRQHRREIYGCRIPHAVDHGPAPA